MEEKNVNLFNFSSLKKGDCGIVSGFFEGNVSYRKKLLSMGITPGTVFKVERIAPFGDPIEISLRGYRLSLRKEEANLISIKKAS